MKNRICPRCETGKHVVYMDANYICLNVIGVNEIQTYGVEEKCWYHFPKNKGGRPVTVTKYCKICGEVATYKQGCTKEHWLEYMRQNNQRYREKCKATPEARALQKEKDRINYLLRSEKTLARKKELKDERKRMSMETS